MMLMRYETPYILTLTDSDTFMCKKNSCCQVLPLPQSSNNEHPDQLAVSIKSHTVCSEPELHIIEGIIVALRWFEVACLTD